MMRRKAGEGGAGTDLPKEQAHSGTLGVGASGVGFSRLTVGASLQQSN